MPKLDIFDIIDIGQTSLVLRVASARYSAVDV